MINQKSLRAVNACKYLDISKSHLWKLVQDGEIKSIKLSPNITVFLVSELDRYLESKIKEGV